MSHKIEHASSGAAWWLYIVECSDGSLYTGITTDVDRRLHEHNSSLRGAKYTRSRRPVFLAVAIPCKDRSEASKLEAQVKGMTRPQKKTWIGEMRCHA